MLIVQGEPNLNKIIINKIITDVDIVSFHHVHACTCMINIIRDPNPLSIFGISKKKLNQNTVYTAIQLL